MEGTQGDKTILSSFENRGTFYFVESGREGTRQRRRGPPYFKKPSGRALSNKYDFVSPVGKTCYFGDIKDPPARVVNNSSSGDLASRNPALYLPEGIPGLWTWTLCTSSLAKTKTFA